MEQVSTGTKRDIAGCLYLKPSMQVTLFKIRQQLDRTQVEDPVAKLQPQLARLDPAIRPGAHIAIAAGSRGIDNLVRSSEGSAGT
jgi:hypothetical protein